MPTIKCFKCGQEAEGFSEPPYPGELGRLALERTCRACFEAWKKFSVMVINDYKLRPFLPKDREVVEKNMKQFLNLEGLSLQQPQSLTGQGKDVTFESGQDPKKS